MIFYHISHTDLDGYGCQLITKQYFPDGKYLNANYGLEVKSSIKIFLDEIKKGDDKEIFFMITDLNLTYDEAKSLDKNIRELNQNGFNIKLQLLDHHGSGEKSASAFEWYFLDTTRCATKITYDYFIEYYDALKIEKYKVLVDAINAVDIWLEDDLYFEFGKVCMSMIAKTNEINNILFANQNRDFRLKLLENSVPYLEKENGYIKLDEDIYFMKKEYLNETSVNDTIDNLSANYLVKMLVNDKDKLTIFYKEHKGLLTFTLGNVSIPANTFLKANSDYDFFIDVSRRGKASFRADGKLNVAKLASKIANGGGHPNAAGAGFDDWVETIDYNEVKAFIQKKIETYEG